MLATLLWLAVGAVTGTTVGLVIRKRRYVFLAEIVLGMAGALAGGWLLSLLGAHPEAADTLLAATAAGALLGAVLLTALAYALPRSPAV